MQHLHLCNNKVKALGLCSGGLDSILSALILKKQGIEVTWITFKTPFFPPDSAVKASKQTGIPLIIEDITDIYMEMLKDPPAGYGKNMNPCMDCHSMMFNQAGIIMREKGYDFLFSGEVAGQRPMSQNKNSMNYVEKHSGFKGVILRPLSAKILPETEMEKKGFVNRELLGNISGRSRKVQIEMAKEFGITDYPPPAGGCLLTDKNFSKRLKDYLEYNQNNYKKRDLYLLKYGRHFRLNEKIKIVVGKTEFDNNKIEKLYKPDNDLMIRHSFLAGPLVLIPDGKIIIRGDNGNCNPDANCNIDSVVINENIIIKKAGQFCAAYTKAVQGTETPILVLSNNEEYKIDVYTPKPKELQHFII